MIAAVISIDCGVSSETMVHLDRMESAAEVGGAHVHFGPATPIMVAVSTGGKVRGALPHGPGNVDRESNDERE
jgi:hypothetical protein